MKLRNKKSLTKVIRDFRIFIQIFIYSVGGVAGAVSASVPAGCEKSGKSIGILSISVPCTECGFSVKTFAVMIRTTINPAKVQVALSKNSFVL